MSAKAAPSDRAVGPCIAGIFVGGGASRMSGVPKGLLQPPGTALTIVELHVELLRSLDVQGVAVVGDNASYRHLGLPIIDDATGMAGPMAGLLGLAEFAMRQSYDRMLALACDMPHLDAALLKRLLLEVPDADALVPRRTHWEPLCARYRPAAIIAPLRQLAKQGRFSLTALLDQLGSACVELPLAQNDQAALDDWDCPDDLPPGVRMSGVPLKRGD